jgi:hypothetical protein
MVRTSITLATSFDQSSPMKSSIGRFEWPMVQIMASGIASRESTIGQ